MQELQIFSNSQFGDLQVTTINDKPYFPATECAKILGYLKPENAIARHCKGSLKRGVLTNGGEQVINFIPEGDLYRLIIRSKLPKAEEFEHWVFDEVLPQIRKTGGYIPVTESDDEKTILAKAVGIYQRTVAEKDSIIATLKPKADEYDAFMNSHGNYSVNAVANIIGYGEYKFFAMLREMKILRYEQGDNVPYGRFRKSGHFIEVATTDPRGFNHTTTYVTPKGLSYLSKKFSQTINERTVA